MALIYCTVGSKKGHKFLFRKLHQLGAVDTLLLKDCRAVGKLDILHQHAHLFHGEVLQSLCEQWCDKESCD